MKFSMMMIYFPYIYCSTKTNLVIVTKTAFSIGILGTAMFKTCIIKLLGINIFALSDMRFISVLSVGKLSLTPIEA